MRILPMMRNRFRLIGAVLLAGLLGLAVYAVLSRHGQGRTAAAGRPRLAASSVTVPSGEGVLLEFFAPQGSRLWRLELAAAALQQEQLLEATKVQAWYYGTKTASRLAADALSYQSNVDRLVFSGHVSLKSPDLSLTCARLVWSPKDEAFQASGGYVLTRDKTVVRGDYLRMDAELKNVHLGPSKFTAEIPGGDALP